MSRCQQYRYSLAALGLLRAAALLPVGTALQLGRWLGPVLGHLLPYRRHVAATNLRLCFPNLSAAGQKLLLREHLAAVGMGVMEMALAWWAPQRRLAGLACLEGSEHLRRALARGKGVLLVTGHFTAFEMGGRLILDQAPVAFTFQALRNPVFHRATEKARRLHARRLIQRGDSRALLRALRDNQVVWYAPDQDAGRRGVFAPFFGIAAATHTATARIARLSGAAVLPYTVQRLCHPLAYRLTIHAPLDAFPGNDACDDAARTNAILESEIRRMPEQYLWVHRRFKTRPHGEARPYPQKRRRSGQWPLRNLSCEAFERRRRGSQVLSRDAHGEKVLRTADGLVIKLFRSKRLLTSARFYSHARRFARNAARLQQRAIPSVTVEDVRRLSSPPRDLVVYRELPGQSLRERLAVAPPAELRRCLLDLAAFMATLHAKGIYFRSLHLGNVLCLPDARLALIDVSDLRIRRRPLNTRARARNFRHLLRRPEDAAVIEQFGLQAFFLEYCRCAELGPLQRRVTSRMVTSSWSALPSGRMGTNLPGGQGA